MTFVFFVARLQRFNGDAVEFAADGVDVGEGKGAAVGAVCEEDEDALMLWIDPE